MSPFFSSASFSFLGSFLEKVRARKLQERRFPSRSTYGIPKKSLAVSQSQNAFLIVSLLPGVILRFRE